MSHYYSKKQTSELQLVKINMRIGSEQIELFSGSGVFSKKKLDKGTELLMKNLLVEDKTKEVLDLGCGIGVVGVYAKKKHPGINITLSDVNIRAIQLAKKNMNLYKLEGQTIPSDGFQKIKQEFDLILLNPPQVAGKEVCFRLFQESYEHLKHKGILQIVARHNKGGKTLSEKMKSIFGNMEEIAKGSGYRVYVSQKRNQTV